MLSSPPDDSRSDVLRLLLGHQQLLVAYAYGVVGDWELAEESYQEAAVFMCRRWQDFTPGSDFWAWARAVTRRVALGLVRRQPARRRHRPLGEELLADATWVAMTAEDQGTKLAALRSCLAELPAEQRTLLEHRYTAGVDCDALAIRLGRSLESVYMRLSRLRTLLRRCIERRLEAEHV